MKRGRFITVEGADGAGKSTQLATIRAWCKAHDIDVVFTREPGGTPIGERLRDLLLGEGDYEISDDTELLMMFAARAAHIEQIIQPALEAGKWVVSDRFTDASYAYQGARGIASAKIAELEQWVQGDFRPDLTLLYDLPIETGLQRVGKRGAPDRFEQTSLDYKAAVREIYLARAEAEPARIKVIDSSQAVEQTSTATQAALDAFLAR